MQEKSYFSGYSGEFGPLRCSGGGYGIAEKGTT